MLVFSEINRDWTTLLRVSTSVCVRCVCCCVCVCVCVCVCALTLYNPGGGFPRGAGAAAAFFCFLAKTTGLWFEHLFGSHYY
jgi:multisubunit Na+/H+ antiporter MnhB subunit